MEIFIEKEYKTLLSLSQYNKLFKVFKNSQTIIQTNYYFDNNNYQLRQHGFMARIRVCNNNYTFTLKTPKINNQTTEHNIQLSKLDINNQEIKTLLNNFNLNDDLKIIASATTTRTITTDTYGEWCLDKTNFSNGLTDYELEYELINSKDEKWEYFLDFLKKHKINYIPIKSKISRALNTSPIQ